MPDICRLIPTYFPQIVYALCIFGANSFHNVLAILSLIFKENLNINKIG